MIIGGKNRNVMLYNYQNYNNNITFMVVSFWNYAYLSIIMKEVLSLREVKFWGLKQISGISGTGSFAA